MWMSWNYIAPPGVGGVNVIAGNLSVQIQDDMSFVVEEDEVGAAIEAGDLDAVIETVPVTTDVNNDSEVSIQDSEISGNIESGFDVKD